MNITWKFSLLLALCIPAVSNAGKANCSFLSLIRQSHKASESIQINHAMVPRAGSPKDDRIVKLIEKDGGAAEVVWQQLVYTAGGQSNKVLHSQKGIRLLQAPRTLFGSQFRKDFEVYRDAGIPVVIDLEMPWTREAAVFGVRQYTDNPVVSLQLGISPDRRSSLVLRHERQHLDDYVLNREGFRKELPDLPKSFDAIYGKIERGEPLNWLETKREAAIRGYLNALLESRASEGSLKILFSPDAVREIFLNRRLPFELHSLFNEILLTTKRYGQLFYHSMLIQPTASRNMLFLSKALAYWCVNAHSTMQVVVHPMESVASFLTSREVSVAAAAKPVPWEIRSVLSCGAL